MANNKFLDDYKKYKNIASGNTDEDSLLNQILDSVEDYYKQQYSIYLESADIAWVYSGSRQSSIALPTQYLSLSEIDIDGNSVDLGKFYLNDNLLHYMSNTFPTGYGNVTVKVHAGFDSTSNIPKSLLESYLILSDKFYENAKQNSNSIDSYTDPMSGHMRVLSTLPKTYYFLLQPHLVYTL